MRVGFEIFESTGVSAITTIIDAATVAVDTFADLQAALQNDNGYTTVYLAADLTMTAGISILASKGSVVIDGLYPTDGTGVIHTLTDASSSDTNYTLGVRGTNNNISMTIRNMNIVGRNYYGILFVAEGAGNAGVSAIYENINYTGPQITYNPSGLTRYVDCNITISTGYSPVNECGEVYQVEIGGTTTITQTSTLYPVFWFRGPTSAPSFTILPGANVTINAGLDFMYTANALAMTVGQGASLTLNTKTTICRNSSYRFASVLIDTDAVFTAIQGSRNGYANLYCNGAFTVNENATVYMQSNHASALQHLYFYTAGASLTLNNPRDFALYNNSANCMYFAQSTAVNIVSGQINHWTSATALSTAGGLDDIPNFAWKKQDGTPLQITATATSASTTVTSHNLTDQEVAALPALSSMQLQSARVFSAGNLPLTLEPITDDGYPITGAALPGAAVRIGYTDENGVAQVLTVTTDAHGSFTAQTPGTVPITTTVTVTANIPFLLATVTQDAVNGGELLLNAPDDLPFLLEKVSDAPTLYGREDSEWSLIVSDSRVRSGDWYLYAEIPAPLTGGQNPGRTLPDCLVFVDSADAATSLSNTPLLVYTGRGNGGVVLNTAVSWPATQGILLQSISTPFYNGERYSTPITWTLTDTPLTGNKAPI